MIGDFEAFRLSIGQDSLSRGRWLPTYRENFASKQCIDKVTLTCIKLPHDGKLEGFFILDVHCALAQPVSQFLPCLRPVLSHNFLGIAFLSNSRQFIENNYKPITNFVKFTQGSWGTTHKEYLLVYPETMQFDKQRVGKML